MNTSEPLNTNTRLLRTTPAGFTVASGVVCNSCGVRGLCPRINPPSACADFSPLFVFRSPLIGFNDKFNTFRLGRGMFDRLSGKVGTVATLYEKRKGRVLGYARITGLDSGFMDKMLAAHAHTNHLSIGRGVSKDDAPGFLEAILLKNYKTMLKTADKNDPFTVIHMERIPVESISLKHLALEAA